MVTIPPRFLDEIRNRLSLSEIIGQRIKVTRAGREHKACCPFHNEKSPSFTINDQKQFYHCFGCGAHGDVIGFTMQYNNLSFIEAVETLAAQAGLQMPRPDPADIKKAEQQRDLYALMDEATKFFIGHLRDAPLKYLLDRGMTGETIEKFRIGFAPADGQVLRAHLKGKGFSDAQMLEAGVIKKSTKGGEPYTFFRERIMFPVSDKRGRVVAFGGRILPDNLRAPDRGTFKPPKYINSADTPLFDKGRMLYGESLARQAVRDGQKLIVTEGYMDVIACHQAGFTGAVAPMGTALTEEQVASLWSIDVDGCLDGNRGAILCFDGDNAGRRAAERACERILPLLKAGHSAAFVFLPEGEDPDTLIRAKGQAGFQAQLDARMSLIDFVWLSHTAGRAFDTPEARAGVTEKLMNVVAAIADKTVQTHYRRAIQDRISSAFFPKRESGLSGTNKRISGADKSLQKPKLRKPSTETQRMHDRIFLATLLNHPYVFHVCEDSISQYDMRDTALTATYQAMLDIFLNEGEEEITAEVLQEELTAKGFADDIRDILRESIYVHASFASPRSESTGVISQFETWLGELNKRNWGEIRKGWRIALHESNEEYEGKLREMVKMKSTEQ